MTSGVYSVQPAGDRVGGYVLRQFLAQGGMAELFLASPIDPARSHEIVVVKRVLPQFAQDLQFARMFAREASLASILKHPNIVEVFGDEGISEAECFFAMEYVHGPDLNIVLKHLKQHAQPMPLEHALQIAMGMCAGLHHAHAKLGDDGNPLAIVHRDVSPSNVMISADGHVKITDFGVAKALALTSFTQAGTRKGKLSYMSPEQAVADPVDQRTDIFAIGAVLFEMTTLQRMFGGENELAVMHKLLFRERPRPSSLRHDYPPELERILLKAVAQKPEERYETAEELRLALADFAQRRRLVSDENALSRWIATVIPSKPHPASDPSFFMQDIGPTTAGLTTHPGNAAATVANGFAGNATVLEGSNSPQPQVGQIGSHTSQVAEQLNTSTTPAPITVGSLTAAQSYSAAPARPVQGGNSGATIIAISLGLAVIILGGAFGYAAIRDERASEPKVTEPAKTPDAPQTNIAPGGTPPAVDPFHSSPAVDDSKTDDGAEVDSNGTPPAAEPTPPDPTPTAAPSHGDTPDQGGRSNSRAGKGSRRNKKKRNTPKPQANEPKPLAPTAPKSDPKPEPEPDPKPTTTKKKKDRLDQLFPTG